MEENREGYRESELTPWYMLKLITKRAYLEMQEEIEDLQEENEELQRELGRSGNKMYLDDAASWAALYREAVKTEALANAEVERLKKIVDDQQALIDRYRTRVKALEAEDGRVRDEATGQYKSPDNLTTEQKQLLAFWMREAGKTDQEITAKIGVKSVRQYVSEGKRLAEGYRVEIGGEDVAWTTRVPMSDMNLDGTSKQYPRLHVIGDHAALFDDIRRRVAEPA